MFNIFGVRHLSPAAAWHLNRYLDELKPRCVLVEGPADAVEILRSVADKRVKPPVALMAYTTEFPIETVLYPFAEYSPEYQAIVWAVRHKVDLRFIDLPSDIILKLKQERTGEDISEERKEYYRFHNGLYDRLSASVDEDDYDSYWERNFEHNLNHGAYCEGVSLQSGEMRRLVVDEEYRAAPSDFACNLIREAHMRREIQRVIGSGVKPEQIVAVVGAYHVSGLHNSLPAMTDDELAALPRVATRMTLMPYSYHRLSSRTGYGAGNRAPYYYEMMWQCMQEGTLDRLPAIYLSHVGGALRAAGSNASSASVIEAVRLANSLSSLHGGSLPVLRDLHDAAVTCLGYGDLPSVAGAINMADIGAAIGSLPEGLSQTPVQDDVSRELKRLKLANYKSTVAQELALDLRENRQVKSGEAAFIDLNRSTFFHRLKLLGIHFSVLLPAAQAAATWSEKWSLQWTPEIEIEVVESNLKGETLEIAAAFELKERLDACTNIRDAAALIRTACECRLIESFTGALGVLQQLGVDSGSFRETAGAARELSVLIRYGDIRRFDLAPLVPLLQQLFLRGALLAVDAASCDDKAANEIATAINTMDLISQEQYDVVDSSIWMEELRKLAMRDDRNTRLSGVAFSILLERNTVSDDDCAREVSRRLSPGIPAELGAGWFAGLSGRNRYALLSRISLWRELDRYIQSLDQEEFYRSAVFLRRTFGSFEPNHKNSIAELLGDFWNTGAEHTAETLTSELTETETQKLDELNDFEFDF
ncbi:MAG: DUF5682 family protein [Bacteroidales bacterium]|jgi:hypothetical protein|nr:DUF5682 family protein [Bacteroidales bacterium]